MASKKKKRVKPKISKSQFIRKFPKSGARFIAAAGKKIGLIFSHKYVYVVRHHDRIVAAAKRAPKKAPKKTKSRKAKR